MKHSATDVIRRGFENTIANWPLLMIRVAEQILLIVLAVVAVIAAIVPVVVSLGLNAALADDPSQAMESILRVLVEQWLIILYVIAIVTLVIILFVAIHSFVEAGSARVYVDGERATAALPLAGRAQFRVFSVERWMSGARRDWWSVFWIYNIAWGVAGLIMLAPLLVVAAVMFALSDNPPVMLGVSCLGLALSLLVMIIVGVITNIWCQKAITVCVSTDLGAAAALGEAWRQFRNDAGRHIAVALILFLLMIVGSGVFASISFVGGMSDSPTFALAMLPMQIIGSLANTVFSTIIGAWFLACFASLSVDRTA